MADEVQGSVDWVLNPWSCMYHDERTTMFKNMSPVVLVICCLFVYLSATANINAGDKPEKNDFGDLDISELSAAYKQYLGLSGDAKPILQNVDGDLIVVEFMNVHCANCRVQAVVLNKLCSAIESDSQLKSRAKILSMAVGNDAEEVAEFSADLKTVTPILTDSDLEIRDGLTNYLRTPYTLMLRRNKDGNLIVVDTHRGAIRSYRAYLDEMKVVMQYDETMMEMKQAEELASKSSTKIKLKMPDAEVVAKVQEIMIEISGNDKIEIAAKAIPQHIKPRSYEKALLGDSDGVKYSAVVVNGEPICDVCHEIQFIFVFDGKGEVIGFEPIYLTKGGNEAWSEADIEKTRERVLGKSIFRLMDFNPEVDAVTSATITSAIIFRAIAQGKIIYRFMR